MTYVRCSVTGRQGAVTGTYEGYLAHARAGEDSCKPCARAGSRARGQASDDVKALGPRAAAGAALRRQPRLADVPMVGLGVLMAVCENA